jgi:hypothetical protein
MIPIEINKYYKGVIMENLYKNFSKTIEAINKDKEKKNISLFGGLIIFAMMVVDFITVKTPLDLVLTQSEIRSILVAIAAVAGLDILPAIFGDRLSKSDKSKKKWIYFGGFILSFCMVTILRVTTVELDFNQTASLFADQASSVEEYKLTKPEIGLTIFNILLPCATSIVSFAVGYNNNYHEDQVKINRNYLNNLENYEGIFENYDQAFEDIKGEIDKKYKLALDDVDTFEKGLLDYCARELALFENNSDVTSKLLEEKYLSLDKSDKSHKDSRVINL